MESEAAEELSECARYGEEEEIKQVRARRRRRWLVAPAVAAAPLRRAATALRGAALRCAAAPRLLTQRPHINNRVIFLTKRRWGHHDQLTSRCQQSQPPPPLTDYPATLRCDIYLAFN